MNTYQLLDSGDGEKLERFGEVVLRRPDPQALWKKSDISLWDNAQLTFKKGDGKTGSWMKNGEVPEKWIVELVGVKMNVEPTPFKHVGVFPEQSENWAWLKEVISSSQNKEVTILNLFAYTGGATIACAQAGANVTHVDSSKGIVTRAHENADLNAVPETSIRWIVDDAIKFVERELRRGKKYDGIIMDPPVFGGLGNDLWKIEKDLVPFIEQCKKLLSENSIFFLINGYASGYSSIAYKNNIDDLGTIEHGELTLKANTGHELPCGIFARWKN